MAIIWIVKPCVAASEHSLRLFQSLISARLISHLQIIIVEKQVDNRDKVTNSSVNLGMFANILLSVLKTLIGIFGHSSALLADGINSTSDVVYYIAVKIFTKQANKPADDDHPYGHRQLESIAALVVGAFIITTGIAIFWEAINTIFDIYTGAITGQSASIYALFAAIFTFFLKIYLYAVTQRNYKATQNPTLRALANDHLNDIMASIAVVIGVIFGRMGYYWMDPLAGAFVALFILRTGITIIMETASELMDTFPDVQFQDNVKTTALQVSGVRNVCDIGLHRFGPYFIINLTIGVDDDITVANANAISDLVEQELIASFAGSLRKVNIHFHPARLCKD